MKLKVLGRAGSINVRKVLWTLDEVGEPYEHDADWGDTKDIKSDLYLTMNPNGRMPVIIDEKGPLWESQAISRYIAAKAGRTDLLPADPRARAEVEKWMDWAGSDLTQAFVPAFLGIVRKAPQFSAEQIAASEKMWTAAMRRLDVHLEKHTYVCGDQFTLADIPLALMTHRYRKTPLTDHAKTPSVDAWMERLAARPAFQSYCSDATP